MRTLMLQLARFSCVLALGLSSLMPASAAPTFTVTASPANAGVGYAIGVDVFAQDFTDLYDYQFDLNFDPARFAFVSGGFEGSFLSSAGSTFFFGGTPAAGSIQFVFDTLLGPGPGATGSGLLAHFNFTALATGIGTFSIANVLAQNTQGNLITTIIGSPAQVAVPEPASLPLIAAALLGCLVTYRRKRTPGA